MSKSNTYEKIQEKQMERIENQLEEMKKDPTKVFQWIRPWKTNPPYNYSTKKRYSGINLTLLDKGGAYLTFVQAKKMGYTIRKGAKSSIIVRMVDISKSGKKDDKTTKDSEKENKDKKDKIEEDRSVSYLVPKIHNVFHESDIVDFFNEDIKDIIIEEDPTEIQNAFNDLLNLYAKEEGIKIIEERNNRAFYTPSQHQITLPLKEQFISFLEMLSTKAHEAAHSTGHESLGNRDFSGKFGSDKYAKEELIAEISSSLLFAMFNLTEEKTERNQIAYIKSWSTKLKENPKLLTESFRAAQSGVEFIMKYCEDDTITI